MNEFEVQKYLRDKRSTIKTKDELFSLISEVESKFNCGYGEAPRAIAQASVAVAEYLLSSMGCTGFQAGCVLWDIIKDLQYSNNTCGMRLIDYDKMLFPQYLDTFSKTISKDTWQAIQDKAKKNLEAEKDFANSNVVFHWKSIVSGNIPFGYEVSEE